MRIGHEMGGDASKRLLCGGRVSELGRVGLEGNRLSVELDFGRELQALGYRQLNDTHVGQVGWRDPGAGRGFDGDASRVGDLDQGFPLLLKALSGGCARR